MNIKNIFIFFSLLPAHLQAITIEENIERTKQEFFKCRKLRATQESTRCITQQTPINCTSQQQAYSSAKQEFFIPLAKIEADGIEAYQRLTNPELWLFRITKNQKNKLNEQIALAYIASVIGQCLLGRHSLKFEGEQYDEATIQTFCTDVLNYFKDSSAEYSYAADRMGPYIITDQKIHHYQNIGYFVFTEQERERTTTIIDDIMKKQLQETSQDNNNN